MRIQAPQDFSVALLDYAEGEVAVTSVLVPEEAASHLTAIQLALNRQTTGTLLDEADELANAGLPISAILIAGTVLEFIGSSPVPRHPEVAEWRQLRNQAAHRSTGAFTVQQARQLIEGVRQLISDTRRHGERRPIAAAQIKGKYSHVPTSSADFMERKRDELEREDRR
jgi:hypothetical protein